MGDALLIHGSLAFDLLYYYPSSIADHFSPVMKEFSVNIRAEGPVKFFGGCAGNVAYTAALFGVSPVVSSWVGEDGRYYIDKLRRNGVNVSQILVDKKTTTSTAVLLKDASDNQWIIFGEPRRTVTWDLPDLSGISFAVITSGMPERTRRLIKKTKSLNITLIIDPGKMIADMCGDDLIYCIENADYIVLNRYELNLLSSTVRMPVEEIIKKTGTAVVTDGSSGSDVFAAGKEPEHIDPAPVERPADPYGAGDAFLGGFCTALFCGKCPIDAAKTGTVAAAYAIEAAGTQSHTFTAEQFQHRYASVFGT